MMEEKLGAADRFALGPDVARPWESAGRRVPISRPEPAQSPEPPRGEFVSRKDGCGLGEEERGWRRRFSSGST